MSRLQLDRVDRYGKLVDIFGRAQVKELLANDYKGGWSKRSLRRHKRDLDYHVAKLVVAARQGQQMRVVEYAADVANHAMFVAEEYTTPLEGVADLGWAVNLRAQEPGWVFPGRRFYFRMMFTYPRCFMKAVRAWVTGRADYEGATVETSDPDVY